MNEVNVAVYGSLKRGLHNHHLLASSSFLGEYETGPSYSMVDLGYFPGLIAHGCTAIQVEVYAVTDAVLRQLDILEGAPHFYERTTANISFFGDAYLYLLSSEYAELLERWDDILIPSGKWS